MQYLLHSPLRDVHNTTMTITDVDIDLEERAVHHAPPSVTKLPPRPVALYSLEHDVSDAGGLEPVAPADRKFGAGMESDASSRLVIADADPLNPADALLIHCWVYLPGGVTPPGGTEVIVQKGTFWWLHVFNGQFRFRFRKNGTNRILAADIVTDRWVHVTAYAGAASQRLYVDGIELDGASHTGSLDTGDDDVDVFGASGGSYLRDGAALAWLLLARGTATDQWIRDAAAGILDLSQSSLREITTIPLIDGLDPQPDATAGQFFPS